MSNYISTWFCIDPSVSEHQQKHFDLTQFSMNLLNIYQDFDNKGYDVVNVVPINMGQPDDVKDNNNYPVTRAAVVIGKFRLD